MIDPGSVHVAIRRAGALEHAVRTILLKIIIETKSVRLALCASAQSDRFTRAPYVFARFPTIDEKNMARMRAMLHTVTGCSNRKNTIEMKMPLSKCRRSVYFIWYGVRASL